MKNKKAKSKSNYPKEFKSGMMSTGSRTIDSGQELVHHNTLSEHAAIAEVLTEMDGELAVLEQRREMTRALKREIITGRTRLV